MLPDFIKVFDFLLHSLESSFLRATPLVPTHKDGSWCKMKRFSNWSRFKTWNSIPIPLKAGILGTKHKILHSTKIWGAECISLPSWAELALGLLTWTRRKSWAWNLEVAQLGLRRIPSIGLCASSRGVKTLEWLNVWCVWCGSCWDIAGAQCCSCGWSWQEFTWNKNPTCPCVCRQLSALQVSHGFVVSTSGASPVALSHQNLSQVGLWSVPGVPLLWGDSTETWLVEDSTGLARCWSAFLR